MQQIAFPTREFQNYSRATRNGNESYGVVKAGEGVLGRQAEAKGQELFGQEESIGEEHLALGGATRRAGPASALLVADQKEPLGTPVDGLAWSSAFDPGNDFRLSFPVGCRDCGTMLQADAVHNQNRIRFRRDSPHDWRETHLPWAYDEEEWMEAETMARSPMSLFLDFHEARTEAQQRAVVVKVKKLSERPKTKWSGGDAYAGLVNCIRNAYRPGMTREIVGKCLENWVQRGRGNLSGERAKPKPR